MIARTALRAAQIGLAVMMAAYLLYFADHARQILGFPHPLDYGEGPLLAQVEQVRAGTPIWQLYADPTNPPYLIINYPPLYLLLCAGLSTITGSALLAGRLISLLAALSAVAAIARLGSEVGGRRQEAGSREPATCHLPPATCLLPPASCLLPLLLLTIPIVREWAVLMRVDLLGLSLGLWGLVALSRRRPALAGMLLLACLFTKPSLIAAPATACLWLLTDLLRANRTERGPQLRTMFILGGTLVGGGGLLFGMLQSASGGWFATHVIAANANRWDASLAQGFWKTQIQMRWPLAAAALVSLVAHYKKSGGRFSREGHALPSDIPALIYTLFGAIIAAGVGKVGAYSNYFLELYVGLVWIVASRPRLSAIGYRLSVIGLLIASMITYPPLWDPFWPRQAGLVAPSPPRLAVGRYGLWDDARREGDLLAAFGRVDTALEQQIRAAGPQIFTDMPGTAAAAGVVSRMQVFEARQLIDQGLADQSALLVDLSGGTPPLAVLDFLGNWLTPEIVAVLRHRYAQDGSLGTFDLYRPVDAGPQQAIVPPARMGTGLDLTGYALAAPLSATYEPGELLTIALNWRREGVIPTGADIVVAAQITTPGGHPLLESELPLIYAALPPERWPAGADVQHLQTLALPAELPPGRYELAVELRTNGEAIAPARQLVEITMRSAGGRTFEETGAFVPAPIMRAWAEYGGIERIGLPLTPVVPFAWGRLQCFERACLELRNGTVGTRPLGTQLYLAETIRSVGCPDDTLNNGVCAGFKDLTEQYGRSMGTPVSGELLRNDWLVQWTTEARLERRPATGDQGLGRLGEESLRLPPGQHYRWP